MLVLRDYFAPDAPDSVCQEEVRFLHFKRTTQTMGEYLTDFDLLRRRVEGRMLFGGLSSLGSLVFAECESFQSCKFLGTCALP